MLRITVIRFIETFLKYPFTILLTGILLATSIYVPYYIFGLKTRYQFGATLMVLTNDTVDAYRDNQLLTLAYWEINEIMADELNGLIQTDAFMRAVLDRVDMTDPAIRPSLANRPQRLLEETRENIEIIVIDNDRNNNKIFYGVYGENPAFTMAVTFAIYDLYLEQKIQQGNAQEQEVYTVFNHILYSKNQRQDLIVDEITNYIEAHPKDPIFDRREIEEFELFLLDRELEKVNQDIAFFEDAIYLYDFNSVTSERSAQETYVLVDTPLQPWAIYTKPGLLEAAVYLSIYIGIAWAVLLVLFLAIDQTIIFPLDIYNLTDLPILTMTAMEIDPNRKWYQFVRKRKAPTPIIWAWTEFSDPEKKQIKRKPLPAPVPLSLSSDPPGDPI